MSYKIRVLFVDDEPNVLAAIRRMLRSKHSEWDMAFAKSGKESLELFAENPFDVVVSDIRMPEMDGAELLQKIKDGYPNTIRIALSGQVGLNEVIRSIRAVHQYISKPCDANDLVAKIEGAIKSREVLNDVKMQKLVSEIDALPVIPHVFKSIEEELKSTEPSINKVAELISLDVGLVAKILKLINSPYFGLPSQVSSIFQAITMLGLDTIKALVLGTHLFSMYDEKTLPRLSLTMLWEHSFRVSNIARIIAEYENLERSKIVNLRMAGLLHDVGKLVLANSFPNKYQRVIDLVASDGEAVGKCEKQVFGTTHAEVGAYLMGLWGMSGEIVYGIGYHHSYEACDLSTPMLVSIADTIDHQCIIINKEYIRGVVNPNILNGGGSEKLKEWVDHIAKNWEGVVDFNVLDSEIIDQLRK
ncbi:response regulator [Marinifilum sp. JC120]|nr:response regulator [Marinifilum sp. JC120]